MQTAIAKPTDAADQADPSDLDVQRRAAGAVGRLPQRWTTSTAASSTCASSRSGAGGRWPASSACRRARSPGAPTRRSRSCAPSSRDAPSRRAAAAAAAAPGAAGQVVRLEPSPAQPEESGGAPSQITRRSQRPADAADAASLHAELAEAAEREEVSLNQFITNTLSASVGWHVEGGELKGGHEEPAPPELAAGGARDEPRGRDHRGTGCACASGRRPDASPVTRPQPARITASVTSGSS